MYRRAALLALGTLIAAAPGFARAADPQVNAQYRVFAHGFHVADASASYKLTPWGYGITTHIVAGGLLSVLIRMDVVSHAEGRFEKGWVAPMNFGSGGYSRGKTRHVEVTYQNGAPVVTQLTPPENDRVPVADDEKRNAIDTLSAMALLLNTIEQTGHCDGASRVFDGIRLTAMTVHGPTEAEVPETSGEVFLGKSLRCDFVGQQVAGFIKDTTHLAEMKAPHNGSAWFQSMPGLGLVAIRIEFDHPKLGHMIAILDRIPQKT
ncbi:DUF3108 domain-containing protein [Acidomonas methanolica]|uniref:DUF3108 domain-containing protein n=1 Tax=Acidomonas methanolica TaxID=437 RepID=UPI00211A9039|nr:DUF3108 domain-containing protein [Acidomonas methanolica]MCQ9154602.1 DUF3108 domain-containing protein [Acidomonas methanolica]